VRIDAGPAGSKESSAEPQMLHSPLIGLQAGI
jgi:hypothetical protein